MRRLFVVVLIDAVGMGMFMSFSALYLTRVIGLDTTRTGIAIAISGMASIVALMPLSTVAERLGARRALVLFSLCRAASFVLIVLAGDFTAAIVTQAIAGLFSRIITPVSQSVAVDLAGTEAERVSLLAGARMVRNTGLGAGAVPGAVAAGADTRTAYLVVIAAAAAVFAYSAWLARGLPVTRTAVTRGRRRTGEVYRDRRFVLLTLTNCLLLLHASILVVGFPLWVLERTTTPVWVASVLMIVNTALAVVLQVRLSRGSEDVRTAAKLLRRAAFCLAFVCAVTPVSAFLPGALSAAVLIGLAVGLTIGEVWNSAGAWGLVVNRLTPANRDQYLAFFNVGSSAATVVWPAALGVLLTWGATAWYAMAGWFTLLGLLIPFLATRRTHDRDG